MDDSPVRANAYSLLAACLLAAPTAELLAQLAALPAAAVDDTGQALTRLQQAAATEAPAVSNDDYHQLFIGLGRGKVVPYASFYLTGSMMDKPLASLRAELAALGVGRQEKTGEPEDHAGALCELMAMLCRQNSAESFSRQKKIFDQYLAGWMESLFSDIVRSADSRFYLAAGDFGAAFMRFEKRYFSMLF